MKPVPLHPNLPTPTTAFGNPAPIAQYYICPHCNEQSPLVRQWQGITDAELREAYLAVSGSEWCLGGISNAETFYEAIEARLREKNNG